MALTDDEKRALEELQRKAEEPDDDEFDIEIWDDTGAGAKLPYRKGKNWLQRFGIDLPEAPAGDESDADTKRKPKTTGQPQQPDNHAQRYFGKKPA